MMRRRIHIVQTYGFYSNLPGILAARLALVPAIVASRRDMGDFLTPVQRRLEYAVWRLADRVVVNATAIKESLAESGVSIQKIVVIPNGVVCHEFFGDDRPNVLQPRVGMVANFRRQKDHFTFLDAAKIVLSHIPDARFMLIGGGPREHEVSSYAREHGLEGHVDFLGTMTETEVSGVLKSLTVSVLSSHRNEGLPNVVLEAMAASKPVIATDVGGTREAIEDGQTGFLIPPRNAEALAEKVICLLQDRDKAIKMGMAGRRRAESLFSLSRMRESFENLYAQLLSEKGFCVG
jgi:glycosyltransferase involved in cell wall biosynthesis